MLGTRFVLTEKDDGNIKARFVIKGFQEDVDQSDSPTASRDTLKVFFTITANERWIIEGSDVRAAFLQSDIIDRNVFIEPPPQKKKPNIIWKLRKPSYGLKDASRKWFKTTERTLMSLGMKQCLRDSCLFYYVKDGKLKGMILFHVDNFLSSGDENFVRDIMDTLRKK